MEQTTPTTKTYYVGRYTAGICLVLMGTLYIVSLLTEIIELTAALKLWPVMLIGMGAELLVCAIRSKGERIRYDWLSIVIMLVMTGCAVILLLFNYMAILLPAVF